MATALQEAKVKPSEIGFILGGGSGARAADRAEMLALQEVFEGDSCPPVTSPKSVVGDMNEASGVTAIIAAIDTLQFGEVAPVFHCHNPEFPNINVVREPTKIKFPRALVSNRNFMGNSICLVLETP